MSESWVVYSAEPSAMPSPSSAGERPPELADVGKLLRRGIRSLTGVARAEDRVGLAGRLSEHLGATATATATADVVVEEWQGYEQVNVQAGLEAWLATGLRHHELVGIVGFQHRRFGLADLLLGAGRLPEHHGLQPGSPAMVNRACGPDGAVRSCVRCGLYLATQDGVPMALLLRGPDPESGLQQVTVQIVSAAPEVAARVARELRDAVTEHNVFRGQVLSFGQEVFGHGETLLQFHPRPVLASGQLVLPDRTRAEIERQAVSVARHAERLRAAGQHLKRGLLLYGPPGVGKTHTIRYLTGLMSGATVVQLTGNSLHLVAEACSVARALQPAMVVIEDVDLIAEDRGMHPGHHPMLFQLLNEMDGLAEDADVLFVLTTNRADLLEPALAARPGRVDQAVELTLPDLDARRALFSLYRGDLDIDTTGLDDVLARTDGVTASFLKELLRRASLLAADQTPDDGSPLHVAADTLADALGELLDTRNAMTRVLLGGNPVRG